MECCFTDLDNCGLRLQWDITEACNLNCIHCCAEKNNNIYSYSRETIEKVAKVIFDNNVKKVTLSGGEPTLNRSLSNIVKEINDYKIPIGIITNLFYDIKVIEPYLNFIDTITTSIDGVEDIHNEIRGNLCYNITKSNIEYLIKNNKKVKVIMTLQKINFNCLEEAIYELVSIGVTEIMLAEISPKGRAVQNGKDVNLQKSKYEIENIVNYIRNKYKIQISTSQCDFLKDNNTVYCKAGKSIIYLDSALMLHPCHLRVGKGINIFKENAFEEICKLHRL